MSFVIFLFIGILRALYSLLDVNREINNYILRNSLMTTGTVKWFNANKGYGFISPDEGDQDVFVHITALESAGISKLDDGQKVSYEITNNRGRDSATDIQLID